MLCYLIGLVEGTEMDYPSVSYPIHPYVPFWTQQTLRVSFSHPPLRYNRGIKQKERNKTDHTLHCLFLSHQREISIVGKVKCLSPDLPLLVMLTPLYRSVFVPMTVRSKGSLLLRISALISNAGREGVTRESSLHLTSSLPYLAQIEQQINSN